jgi:choline dehydrogenase
VNLSPQQQALKQEAERRVAEWQTAGTGLAASSLADGAVFCSTGLGDMHSHMEIICSPMAGDHNLAHTLFNIDTARFFDDPAAHMAPDVERVA